MVKFLYCRYMQKTLEITLNAKKKIIFEFLRINLSSIKFKFNIISTLLISNV